jgi:hypothetical protein
VGTRLALVELEVLAPLPSRVPDVSELGIHNQLAVDLADQHSEVVLRLLGTGAIPIEIAQGKAVELDLFWEKAAEIKATTS